MRKEDVQRNPRLAGQVRRYHTWMVLRHQSTGEHSWQVLRLLLMIFGDQPAHVLAYAVKHDMGEIGVGDPPFPIKAKNPVLKGEMDRLEIAHLEDMNIQLPELSDYEKVLFKFCDLLDCLEYAKDEVLSGNRFMVPVFDQGDALLGYISRMSPRDQARAIIHCAQQGITFTPGKLGELSASAENLFRMNYIHPGFEVEEN